MRQITNRIFRSLLFVPVLTQKFIDKAAQSTADAVILDLEASIPQDKKLLARESLAGAADSLKAAGKTAFCRVNAGDMADVAAAAACELTGIIVPIVESGKQLEEVAETLKSAHSQSLVFPIIETPLGLYNLREILAADVTVGGLMFGTEDFVLGMGSRALPCRETLFNGAWQVAYAARAHGISPYGLAGSLADFKDMDAFKVLCDEARSMGFVGCPAIHPAQVDVLHAAFSPTQSELDNAREAIQAFEDAGEKAISVGGRMIDYPIYFRLKKMLAEYAGF